MKMNIRKFNKTEKIVLSAIRDDFYIGRNIKKADGNFRSLFLSTRDKLFKEGFLIKTKKYWYGYYLSPEIIEKYDIRTFNIKINEIKS